MGNSKSKNQPKSQPKQDSHGQSSAAPTAASSSSHTPAPTPTGPEIRPEVNLSDDDPAPALSDVPSPHSPEYHPQEEKLVETQEEAVSFWSREKTFRPQRAVPEGASGGAGLRIMKTVNATMRQTLGVGDLEKAVKCPAGEDRNEWLAVNTVQFFNAASLIYGTIQADCTHRSCPIMAAGKAEYLWRDDDHYKKPTRLPAPVHIDLMMSSIDAQITDSNIFPIEADERFPRNFMSVCKQIYKRLFRLYAHIYCAHHEKIRAIGAAAHLNTIFRHLVIFIQEFQLVDRTEMAPLEKLIARITADSASSASAAKK